MRKGGEQICLPPLLICGLLRFVDVCGIPDDAPGFLLIVRLFRHLSNSARRNNIPGPAEDGRSFLVADHDHLVLDKAARHWRVSTGIAGIIKVDLMKFLVANVKVIEACA